MTLASTMLGVGLLLSFSHKHKLNSALQLDLGRSKKNVQEEKERGGSKLCNSVQGEHKD